MCSKDKETRLKGQRGSVMIMTAIFAVGLLMAVGLAIDISRIYMIRTERQNAADAAAVTAARELDGGSGGIDNAVTKASAVLNTQGFNKAGVTITSVEFAVNLNDNPYMDQATARTAANAPTIHYVRVTTAASTTPILFALQALGASRTEGSQATAGQSIDLTGICDFFPAAVALDSEPAVGALLTLNFNQGTGNGITLANYDYAILEVPQINGNGTGETATLCAGIPNFCKKTGDTIHMTPSSNQNNGPKNCGDGTNTRFNIYANGYGSALQPGPYPPDTNVKTNISATDYLNKTAGQVIAPNPNGPGKDSRRLLIAPMVYPGDYPAYATNIWGWGIFFLKDISPTPSNCSHATGCGGIPTEYLGRANVAASGDASCGTGLTTPTLYK